MCTKICDCNNCFKNKTCTSCVLQSEVISKKEIDCQRGPGTAPAAEGSDCTWHQNLCTTTCMIVANTTAGTEQRN